MPKHVASNLWVISGRVAVEVEKGKGFPFRSMKAYNGSRSIAPSILNLGIIWKWLNSRPGRFAPWGGGGRSPAVHCKGGWVTRAGLDVLKKEKKPPVPTGIRTQELPAGSCSLRQTPSNYMHYNTMQSTVLWGPFHATVLQSVHVILRKTHHINAMIAVHYRLSTGV
jgi:hypothetical protein